MFAHREFASLGTYAYLATTADLDVAEQMARDILADVDRTCSRFRTDSDLNRANANAGSWTRVDPLLVAAVSVAIAAADVSGGLVDPCLGIALTEIGYDADFGTVSTRPPSPLSPRTPHPFGRWRELEVDPEGAVRVPAGVRLDLGATAKAWASDLVALSLVEETGAVTIVSLGGDIRVATPPGADDFEGWPVSITEAPQTAGAQTEPGEVIIMEPGGLATSSSQVRRWTAGGVTQHHLIDPRTGCPAPEVWRTVTATGPTCVAANIASTTAIVLGAEAVDWLEEHDVDARLIAADGSVHRAGRWPAPVGSMR